MTWVQFKAIPLLTQKKQPGKEMHYKVKLYQFKNPIYVVFVNW